MFSIIARATVAALTLTAATAGVAQAGQYSQYGQGSYHGMELVDAHAMSNAGANGGTHFKSTEVYRGTDGRTVTVTKTRTTYPEQVFTYSGNNSGGWTLAPQAAPKGKDWIENPAIWNHAPKGKGWIENPAIWNHARY